MNSKLCEQCQLSNKKVHLIPSTDFETIKTLIYSANKKKNMLWNICISSFSITTALLFNVCDYWISFVLHSKDFNFIKFAIFTSIFICSLLIGIVTLYFYLRKIKGTDNLDNLKHPLINEIHNIQDKSEVNLMSCKCIVGDWTIKSKTFESKKYTTGNVTIIPDSFGFKFQGPLIGDKNKSIAEVNSELCQYFPKEGYFKAVYEMTVNDKNKRNVKEKSSFNVRLLNGGQTLEGSWTTLDADPFRSGSITLEKVI